MKWFTRMMLANPRREDQRRDGQRELGFAGYGDGQPEDRFRDRRGREHYDNGRYAPRNDYNRDWDPPRDGGKYNGERPMGSRYPHPEKIGNPYYPDPRFMPYFDGGRGPEREVQPVRMNKIGFSMDGELERYPDEFRDYRSTVEHPRMDEMQARKGSFMAGHSAGEAVRPMDKEAAEAWTRRMKNEDGTTGPHWTMEQTKQVQSQKGIDWDPVEFWAAMNMIYSDYSKVAKKLNINSAEFYACMAEAFLDDKDAQPDKLARYYQYIVKR